MASRVASTRVALAGDVPGFLSTPCDFQLSVHSDGSLTGTVTPSTNAGHAFTEASYLLFNGVAVGQRTVDGSPPARYHVTFRIAKLSDLPGVIFYIDVEGELSATEGFDGRWKVSGASAREPGRPFHLATVRREEDAQNDESAQETTVAMHPLTQGAYTLRGATIGDNGFLYRQTWTLRLRPHGVLQGTSQEDDNAPQLCDLEGSWTRTRIQLLMTYVVGSVVGTYRHDGDVVGGGLRGRCVKTDAPDDRNEQGNFEFVCVEATRHWNPDDHACFPQTFQSAVRTCLLSSLRASDHTRLPSLLWQEVFSYCSFDWFSNA